jgi:hypothetical protein
MDEEQYRRKGREMTLNYLAENDLLIHMYGFFALSAGEYLDVYHDPSEKDPEQFYFESPHGFSVEFVDKREAVATEI